MPILPCRPLSCSPEINHAAITCGSCGEGTPICCLKITRPSWDQYVVVKRTGYTIGDSCTGTSATNFCGNLSAAVSTGGDAAQCFTGSVLALWSNNADCDIRFSVGFPAFWSGGVIVPAKTFSGVVPSNWNASTLSLSSWDASETITVDVCDGTEKIFPPSDPDLMLKATLWVDTGAGLSPDIPADLFGGGIFDPPVQKYARGNGTTICGIAQLCKGDTITPEQMWWYYERDTGDVRVTISTPGGAVSSTPSTADFAWSETWADSGFVVPLPSGVLGVGITGEWRVIKVTDCADDGCDSGCYPACLKCPSTASLALVIEEDLSCCLSGTFDLQYNGTDDQWQTWPPGGTIGPSTYIGGPDGVCGIIKWAIVSCGSDSGHINLQFLYRDVNGSEFTANYDLAITCNPSFETDYATLASNPFAPGLCDGGFFRGSKLRVIAV